MDILEYNRQAWNRESLNDGEWSVPVSEEIISAARNGAWQVVLTPLTPVPKARELDLEDQVISQFMEHFCTSCGATVRLPEARRYQESLRPQQPEPDPD